MLKSAIVERRIFGCFKFAELSALSTAGLIFLSVLLFSPSMSFGAQLNAGSQLGKTVEPNSLRVATCETFRSQFIVTFEQTGTHHNNSISVDIPTRKAIIGIGNRSGVIRLEKVEVFRFLHTSVDEGDFEVRFSDDVHWSVLPDTKVAYFGRMPLDCWKRFTSTVEAVVRTETIQME